MWAFLENIKAQKIDSVWFIQRCVIRVNLNQISNDKDRV